MVLEINGEKYFPENAVKMLIEEAIKLRNKHTYIGIDESKPQHLWNEETIRYVAARQAQGTSFQINLPQNSLIKPFYTGTSKEAAIECSNNGIEHATKTSG